MSGTTRYGLVVFVAAATILVLAGAGCDTGDASKAGGSSGPLTLRIATAEQQGRPSATAIKEFARQVEPLSDGRTRVEIVWEASGDNARAWDQRVARAVSSGKFELGWIPARAWDTEGVTSLRALQAPFLITNDALVQEVLHSRLADEMLRGLATAGVVGLALYPSDLRHPVGLEKPLRTAADYQGAILRVPRSQTSYALFRSLGANPEDHAGSELERAVTSGSVRGAESAFGLIGSLEGTAIYTGNVTFYPKVDTLVVGRGAYEKLTAEQRELLSAAAKRTAEVVQDEGVSDLEAAERLCQTGGTIVHADPAEVRALERAAEPVYAELSEDPGTAAMIERIRQLKRRMGKPVDTPPLICAHREPRQMPAPAGHSQSIPNGVYRKSLTKAELVEAGLPPDENPADYNGVHTLTLDNGRFKVEIRSDIPHPPDFGSYESSGGKIDVITVRATGEGWTGRWSLRNGLLRHTDIRARPPTTTALIRAIVETKPYRKIK
jgi:TRAP-type C4-dicarboxylate transport system substrate-binding protein